MPKTSPRMKEYNRQYYIKNKKRCDDHSAKYRATQQIYGGERNMSTTLESWSTNDLITISFDASGLPVDLNKNELRQLIDALEDLDNLSIPDELGSTDTVYKEYAIKEDK